MQSKKYFSLNQKNQNSEAKKKSVLFTKKAGENKNKMYVNTVFNWIKACGDIWPFEASRKKTITNSCFPTNIAQTSCLFLFFLGDFVSSKITVCEEETQTKLNQADTL